MSLLANVDLMGSALGIREAQLALTTSNLVNQNTPNYKAKGIDFNVEIQKALNSPSHALKKTAANHMDSQGSNGDYSVQFIHSGAERPDGNTVNSTIEKSRFAEQQVKYQAALEMAVKSRTSLIQALKDK